MIFVVQNVERCVVTMASGEAVSEIEDGFVVYVGLEVKDVSESEENNINKAAEFIMEKTGKKNVMLLSQFTLMAKFKRHKKPSFHSAAGKEISNPFFYGLKKRLNEFKKTESGVFREHLKIRCISTSLKTAAYNL
ncbi:DTD [Enterospora canceri]|uniref:D-aminoacyl-tRNA deacylase n=1 Tax=Enterospora canceri TaxID=1081671 RepID=A0A1Y1S811_9MICR|nr:DTD [Enterospora canceri]